MAEWIAYGVLSVAFFGLFPVCLKASVKRTAPAVGAALYTAMLLLFSLAAAAESGAPDLAAMPGATWLFIVSAGVCAAFFAMCLFRSLCTGLTSSVTPITNLSLVAMTLIPFFSGGGAFTVWKGIFLTLVILGTVLMESRDRRAKRLDWLLFALLAAVLQTASQLLQNNVSAGVGEAWARALCCGVALIVLLTLGILGGSFRTVSGMRAEGVLFSLMAGAAAGMGGLCRAYCMTLGDWALLAPATALTLPFTFLFARLFNSERPSGANVLGLILAAGGMVALTLDIALFEGWLWG